MHGFSPCGACRAMVPSETGCEHWKPQTALGRAIVDRRHREKSRRGRLAQREALAREFSDMLKRSAPGDLPRP